MKPRKMVMADDETEELEECYEACDYAKPGCLEIFVREDQHDAAAAILKEHGHFMGDASTMDPLEILLPIEERGGYE